VGTGTSVTQFNVGTGSHEGMSNFFLMGCPYQRSWCSSSAAGMSQKAETSCMRSSQRTMIARYPGTLGRTR